MQTVKLTPMRMIFNNPESNFSIISCRTKDESIERHPQYSTISLKGTGIADLKMGQSIDCIIEPCVEDKYKYSYKFIGFAGFVAKDGKFNLTEKAELQTLRNLMTNGQAESCHVAYPHFVSMVLNGEEAKLDYKKIRGVGKVLLPRYIDKIKTNNKRVKFMSETYAWGIEHDEDINKIAATYKNVYGFSKDINTNPYSVMINLLEWSFDRADRAIINKTAKWLDSYERCEAATIYALKHNELDGNTRMQAKMLFDMVKRKAPQCVHHLLDVVTKSAQVHYDLPSQNTALQATYSAEQHIADVIKKKIANPHYYPMDWQKFTSVDGLELTDEQTQILEMACKQDVMMLTGSAGCVDCDTEFFTGTGWKRIADYQDGDRVLQYNEDGTAELVNPIAYIKKTCNTLWHFETLRGLNQTVCDDHRIIYETRDGVLKECNIEQLKQMHLPSTKNFQGRFLTTFNFGGFGIDLNEWQIRLMCAVLADGHFNAGNKNSTRCTFHIKKQRKKDRLIYLFNKNGLEYKEHGSTEEGYTDYHVYVPRREKQFTEYWYGCSNEQLKIIVDEVVYWDGCIRYTKNNTKYLTYCSSIKSDADFIQYAASAIGIRASISTCNRIGEIKHLNGKEYIRKTNVYTVHFSNRTKVGLCSDNRSKCTKTPITQVPTTDGYKYCFTVPSHMLVLRRKDCIFITGNCGKTTSMQALVNMLDSNGYTYTLLAPTGISSKKLREATQKEASTIHMFLTMSENLGDYLIIDEASQISVHLLSMLFDKVADTTKIIFIADPSQLASIACGNIVEDMLDSGIVPVCNLTKVFRYNTSGIITIATDVRNGANDHLTDTFTDYKFVETDTLVIKQIEQEYARLLADGYSKDDVLILSPFNKGEVGSLAINAAIQAKFNPNELSKVGHTVNNVPIYFKVGDKVINKKNEYAMPLADDDTAFVANGDIGTVMEIVPDEKEPYMIVRYDCGDCIVDKAHIKNTLLSYCCSIHSVQGSQAKAVIVVIDRSHANLLSRNLIYTSVSRAQDKLVLIGDEAAIQEGLKVQEEKERNTALREMLLDKLTES